MSQQLPPDFVPWDTAEFQPPPPPPRKRTGVRTVILTLILVCAVAVLLNESFFKVRRVSVVGNEHISSEEVVHSAGLSKSISYLALNEEKIAAGINGNRYLIFEGMEKEFPDSVTLYVRERAPKANVQVMGVNYLLDEEGMVLERLGAAYPEIQVITVTGFQAKDIRVGRRIIPGKESQLTAYQLLMEEIELQGFSDQVSELNLSDPDSLYLITVDQFTAHLGDQKDLRAKIGTLRGVLAKLRELGKNGGTIEASVPAVATYTPLEL